MRQLRYQNEDFRYPRDVARIVRVLTEEGYPVSPHEAQRMWDAFSDSMCAGWMMLDTYTDQEILFILTEEATPTNNQTAEGE